MSKCFAWIRNLAIGKSMWFSFLLNTDLEKNLSSDPLRHHAYPEMFI